MCLAEQHSDFFFEDTKTHKKQHKFVAETTKIKYMRK